MVESICPYLSGVDLEGNLVKVECQLHKCPKYIQIIGMNPNTGEQVNEYRCSDAWLPHLLMENTRKNIETGAAVESFRNEVVKVGTSLVEMARPRVAPPEKGVCQG